MSYRNAIKKTTHPSPAAGTNLQAAIHAPLLITFKMMLDRDPFSLLDSVEETESPQAESQEILIE
jgi:hypothetical protein